MAFNRKEFLASFLNQVSGGMQKMREDAEDYKTKEEEAFARNQSLISTRNSRANAAVALGKEALQYMPEGVRSKAMIRTAIASGMTGVKELRDKLAAAHAEAGLGAGETLSLNDIEAVISMPNIPSIDQSLIDMSLEDFAKKTYGATAQAAAVEDETGIVGRLFGFGAKDRVKQELRETSGMGGMSIADVNAAARMQEFNSLIPNAVMSFSEMERFGKTDSFTFSREITEEYDELVTSDAADAMAELALRGYLDQIREGGGQESDVTQATLESIKADARKAYAQKQLAKTIEGYANQYGSPAGGFFQQQFAMDQVAELMGQEWLDELKKGYQVGDEDPETEDPEEDPESVAPVKSLRPKERPELGPEPVDPASVPSLPEGKERPAGDTGGDIVKQRRWDKQYAGRYNPDRTPIIVDPRPTDPDATTTRTKLLSGREYQVNAMEEWDRKYAETHNPDGTPKQFEDD